MSCGAFRGGKCGGSTKTIHEIHQIRQDTPQIRHRYRRHTRYTGNLRGQNSTPLLLFSLLFNTLPTLVHSLSLASGRHSFASRWTLRPRSLLHPLA